jgi:chemotaxis protein CheC
MFSMEIPLDIKDALTEMINIGFGRASASLSALIGQRISLAAPEADLYPVDHLVEVFRQLMLKDTIMVHQAFRGKVFGDVLLVMDQKSSSKLVNLLSEEQGNLDEFSISDREALLEIGNILLNAYIGSFGNLLKFRVDFNIPRLLVDPMEESIRQFIPSNPTDYYSLVVRTEFHVQGSSVDGYVTLILGMDSLQSMFAALLED